MGRPGGSIPLSLSDRLDAGITFAVGNTRAFAAVGQQGGGDEYDECFQKVNNFVWQLPLLVTWLVTFFHTCEQHFATLFSLQAL